MARPVCHSKRVPAAGGSPLRSSGANCRQGLGAPSHSFALARADRETVDNGVVVAGAMLRSYPAKASG